MSGNINKALIWAQSTAWDETHGYDMGSTRYGNPNYDCSSFVYYALQHGGFNVPGGAWSTPSEIDFLLQSDEFTHFIYEDGFVFKNGDILVYDEGGGPDGHTLFFAENIPCYSATNDPRIVISNARVEASGTYEHPEDGDQPNSSGVHPEVRCIKWYFDPKGHEWHIFRPKGGSNPGLLSLLLSYAVNKDNDDIRPHREIYI